jgi:hypothetical protein
MGGPKKTKKDDNSKKRKKRKRDDEDCLHAEEEMVDAGDGEGVPSAAKKNVESEDQGFAEDEFGAKD